MPAQPLTPFSLELIFTGLCLFDITPQGATVLLVNATDNTRFTTDPELQSPPASFPHPHFPRFSYLMAQQVRNDSQAPPRSPDEIAAGPSGDETGICHLEGEDVTLDVPGGSPFHPGLLTEAPSLSDVSSLPFTRSPLTLAALPNSAVVTRFHLANGDLEVLRLSAAGTANLKIDFRTIRHLTDPSGGPERTIADQLVLRIDNLQAPVKIQSSSKLPILLRPEVDAAGNPIRPVSATLSNYHKDFHPPQVAAFDFLWFYELAEFTSGTRPSRRDLPIPYYLNAQDPHHFTGSSGVCPPIKI